MPERGGSNSEFSQADVVSLPIHRPDGTLLGVFFPAQGTGPEEGTHWEAHLRYYGTTSGSDAADDIPEWQPARHGDIPDNWLLLVDPAWVREGDERPPRRAIMGGWLVDDHGRAGLFRPNPEFRPTGPNTPTDPIDAVLRLVGRGEAMVDQLVPTLRDAIVELAVDQVNLPLIGPAPDGVPCVGVATAPLHRVRATGARWREMPGRNLAGVVPRDTDILLNPESPAAFRLRTEVLAG
jgi:hypothetical protein